MLGQLDAVYGDGAIFRGMKPLQWTLVALFVCAQPCAAQDSVSKFSLLLSPALFVPVSVAVQAGIQYKFLRRWSVVGEVAVPAFYPKDNGFEEIDYWRIGGEIKHKANGLRSSYGYFSLQGNYLFRKFTNRDAGIYESKDTTLSYASARIKSPVLSSALKIGLELPTGKRTFCDVFFGMGVRFAFNRYDAVNVVAIMPEERRGFALVPEPVWRYNYTVTHFHLAAGIRVGIRL